MTVELTKERIEHWPVREQATAFIDVEEVPGRRFSIWVRLFPILFFFAYLNFTVFLFAFGPWPWPVQDGTTLYSFLAVVHLSLLFGYLSAAFSRPHGYTGPWTGQRLVVISLIVNLVFLFPTSGYRTGGMLPDVLGGLTDPGTSYAESLAIRSNGFPVTEYLRILFGPILFLLLPLVIFYWGSLRPLVRWLSSFCILGVVTIFIAMGTNKAIADLVLLVPCLVIAGYLAGFLKIGRIKKILIVALTLIGFSFFLFFFTATQSQRSGSPAAVGYFPAADIYSDPDNFVIRYLPSQLKIGVIALDSYLTQGYYALYLSLDQPFVPMFGVGNSMFLTRNVAKILGQDIPQASYPAQIEADAGWSSQSLWHSIYPWLASDVSFPGVILVVFIIGRLFAMSWLDTLKGKNPFAIAAFAQLLIMIFYFPANNQCLQSGESLISFLVIIMLWLFYRNKYVLRKKCSRLFYN